MMIKHDNVWELGIRVAMVDEKDYEMRITAPPLPDDMSAMAVLGGVLKAFQNIFELMNGMELNDLSNREKWFDFDKDANLMDCCYHLISLMTAVSKLYGNEDTERLWRMAPTRVRERPGVKRQFATVGAQSKEKGLDDAH